MRSNCKRISVSNERNQYKTPYSNRINLRQIFSFYCDKIDVNLFQTMINFECFILQYLKKIDKLSGLMINQNFSTSNMLHFKLALIFLVKLHV